VFARDSDIVELDGPPAFEYGEKVQSRKNIRNDGTFPGAEIGDIIVRKGDIGYVKSIGTFLQQFYIYGIDFIERGAVVGMKGRELRSLDYDDEDELGDANEADDAGPETTQASDSTEDITP
jgi:nitrogen fixation protein NifZ